MVDARERWIFGVGLVGSAKNLEKEREREIQPETHAPTWVWGVGVCGITTVLRCVGFRRGPWWAVPACS
jgi:hypothetical protein